MKEREGGVFFRAKEKGRKTLFRAYNASLLGAGAALSYPVDNPKDLLPVSLASVAISLNMLHKRNKKREAEIAAHNAKIDRANAPSQLSEPIFTYSNGYKVHTWDELAKYVGEPAAVVSTVDRAANFIEYHPGDEKITEHMDTLKAAKLLRDNVPDYFLALNNPDAEHHPKALNQKMDEMVERFETEQKIKELEQQFNSEPKN